MNRAARLSVIVPTWCEQRTIGDCVRRAHKFADEIIVADAQSPDDTARIAHEAGARVVVCTRKGRGPQLHAGAEAATGDVLVFLHADADLPIGARIAIEAALRDPDVGGGNFALRFVPETCAARVFTWANDVRRRRFAIYYGDSAIFVRRSVYERLGGFRALPILEDYEFVRRLEEQGKTAYLRGVEVRVSARRFARRPARTLLLWTLIQTLYSAGVPAPWLARLYADLR